MIKNRYDGRKSSLTLFIPTSNQNKVFAKYFTTPPRSKTPITSETSPRSPRTIKFEQNILPPDSPAQRPRRNSQITFSQNSLLKCANNSITISNSMSAPIDELRRHSYHESICPPNDLYLPNYPPLPNFPVNCISSRKQNSTNSNEYFDLFSKKVKLCKKRCNFKNPLADLNAKTVKKQTLLEIVKVTSSQSIVRQFPKDIIDKTIKMLFVNVERNVKTFDARVTNADEIHPIEDPEMAHLSIIYQLFQHLMRVFPQHPRFSLSMIPKLLKQIGSPDTEERVFIQKIILSYYDYHANQYLDIFTILSHALFENREMATSPFSFAPIIYIMQSIVASINEIPPSFDVIFVNAVLPMLTSRFLSYFNASFTNFVNLYCSRKQKISLKVLEALIKYWPCTKNEKQAVFLKLIVSILPFLSPRDIPLHCEKIIGIFADSAVSSSQKVANTAFECVIDQFCESFLMENPKQSFTQLYIPFQTAMNTHWSAQVRDNAKQALMFIRRLNTRVFNEVVDQAQHQGHQPCHQDPTVHKWAIVAKEASINDQSIALSTILPVISKTFSKPKKSIVIQTLPELNQPKQQSPKRAIIQASKSTPMCQIQQIHNFS